MDSKSLIEKYKYYKIQNNILRKNRIHNKDKSSKIEMKIPIKANKYEFFPIESEKSKTDGHTIYLVTEDSNYNNEIVNNDSIQEEIKDNDKDKDIFNEKNKLIQQRNIEIQINKSKFNFF